VIKRLIVRPATAADRQSLLQAVIEQQDYERRLHATRLPGEKIAEAYLDWMFQQVEADGVVLIAEFDGSFVGFIAGWIEQDYNIAETADSNRFGYVSDVCVLPAFRGRRVAARLLSAIEQHLGRASITRLRINSLAANQSARASYEHAGFVPHEILFEKMLGSSSG
jgi:ribosomal protein S18 acetylase RimI-like enzyme